MSKTIMHNTAGGVQISCTTTSKSIKSLIQTAESGVTDADLNGVNFYILAPEGTIRVNVGGVAASGKGLELGDSNTAGNDWTEIEGVGVEDLNLIGVGGTVLVNILYGTKA